MKMMSLSPTSSSAYLHKTKSYIRGRIYLIALLSLAVFCVSPQPAWAQRMIQLKNAQSGCHGTLHISGDGWGTNASTITISAQNSSALPVEGKIATIKKKDGTEKFSVSIPYSVVSPCSNTCSTESTVQVTAKGSHGATPASQNIALPGLYCGITWGVPSAAKSPEAPPRPSEVTPKTNENSGPSIVYRQGGTIITRLSVNADSSASESIACDATDNGGVKSLTLSFPSTVSACTTTSGGGYTGVYTYAPIPPPEHATSTPNAMGQVPTELSTDFTLQGPFTCDNPGVTGNGVVARPYGQTINATCSATNYSGKTSTALLPITFSRWP